MDDYLRGSRQHAKRRKTLIFWVSGGKANVFVASRQHVLGGYDEAIVREEVCERVVARSLPKTSYSEPLDGPTAVPLPASRSDRR